MPGNKEFSKDQVFLQKLKQTVLDNLENEQFGVEDLSDQMGISRSQLHRKLKLLQGKSISSFIREVRLEEAIKLLQNDVATVSEIAYRVGFNSPSYFNKVFLQQYNISPGEWMKNGNTINPPQDPIQEYPKNSGSPAVRNISKYLIPTIGLVVLMAAIFYFFTDNEPKEYSIAVLPLENLTGSEENDYFVDGLHNSLIGELGQINSLRVISRTSTLRYSGSKMLLKDIAKELGVSAIMEGAVSGINDSLKLSVRLIEVLPEEKHLMAQNFSDKMDKVLQIQSSVAMEIARKVDIKLSSSEEQLLADKPSINPETYKNYLRGLYYLNKSTEESFKTAINYFQQAIDQDPGDPLAYAGLAMGYAHAGHGLSVDQAFIRAERASEKALRLNPNLDEVHTVRALLYLYDKWDWETSKNAFESSLAANPNNEIAHAHYAWHHVLFNDIEKSIYHAKKATQIEPTSSAYFSWLAILYYLNEDYENARIVAERSLQLQPDSFYGLVVMGWLSIDNENYQEAIAYHEKLPKSGSHFKVFLGHTYLKANQREKALNLFNELESEAKNKSVNPVHRALMASYLGFTDRAFELLDEGYKNKTYPMTYLNVYPATQFILNDPRYSELMHKLNLPENLKVIAYRSH